MFIAEGVLSAVLQMCLLQWGSMGKMLLGPQGDFFCCNAMRGHCKKLEARLSGGAVSRFHNTSMETLDTSHPQWSPSWLMHNGHV